MPSPSPHNVYARPEPTPEEASPHSVDMSAIAELVGKTARGQYADEERVGVPDEFLDELETLEGTEAEAKPETSEPSGEADDLDSLREKIRRLEEATAPQPTPQFQGIDPNALTQSVVAAVLAAEQAKKAAEPEKMPEPPSFLTTPIDLISDDPEKLQKTIDESNRAAARWAFEQARNQLNGAFGQQNQALQGVYQTLNEFAPLLASHARSEATRFGEANSLWGDDRERDEMLQQAERLLMAQTNAPTAPYKPDAWRAALQYIHMNKPARARESKEPPSAGDGDANRPVSGGVGHRDASSSAVARMAAQLAGRKPTADELDLFVAKNPEAFR